MPELDVAILVDDRLRRARALVAALRDALGDRCFVLHGGVLRRGDNIERDAPLPAGARVFLLLVHGNSEPCREEARSYVRPGTRVVYFSGGGVPVAAGEVWVRRALTGGAAGIWTVAEVSELVKWAGDPTSSLPTLLSDATRKAAHCYGHALAILCQGYLAARAAAGMADCEKALAAMHWDSSLERLVAKDAWGRVSGADWWIGGLGLDPADPLIGLAQVTKELTKEFGEQPWERTRALVKELEAGSPQPGVVAEAYLELTQLLRRA